MSVPSNRSIEIKNQLHPRNKHKYRYDFPELIAACPDLSKYVSLNPYQDLSIDFKNSDAVKTLNKALLQYFYGISLWDIPAGYLCPPIPGRADYIHYIADLLATTQEGVIPRGNTVKVLDIGVGANCIYPLIGNREYGWTFVGSEIDPFAISSAKNIIDANSLSSHITIRKQSSTAQFFTGIIKQGEHFTVTICNPPFHASLKEATAGSERKWKNLGQKSKAGGTLNFGGTNAELWCEGGEERFVIQMIKESADFAQSCQWFTSLISKKDTLQGCYRALDRVKAKDVKVINMAQGQKISRILAWTFTEPIPTKP
ncbi:Ribosomal RNA large subunit methyltransferase F [Arcticibacter svalbardensis MN12-7]|uniref:Ribosomal RNA large subunit methyltransferase F n=1 Tax=Arcticibacter svalbardensis MN12-7 TaxID=1150600 RepID=R9GVE6_9SPHI|nr:23S rRNA (adenine(1618)-N(6))-methyltransferase RlmF [Arcticibacter svalbardensis]EOR95505.1 Ribosomal RNA large subunit methyltransferase F [Arcticibacter svalbardensis MN12-7]